MASTQVRGDIPGTALTLAANNPQLAARGLLAETGSPNNSIGGLAATDGTIHFVGIALFTGMRITGACTHIATAGVAVTLSKVGLYDSTGTRLGLSADQGTAWQTIGSYTIPFTSAVTIATNGLYYAAWIAKGGTVPAPFRTGQSMTTFGTVNSGSLPFGTQTGQTDLIASATIAAGASSPVIPWIGLY